MGTLTKEAILNAQDITMERVHVIEWAGDVFVKSLTGKEKADFQDSLFEAEPGLDGKPIRKKDYKKALRVGMLVRCLCNEQGERLFVNEDIALLEKKSALVLDRLDEVCDRLNGVSKAVVEETAKN